MNKIENLICDYVNKNLMQCVKPKTNKKVFEDFALLAKYAYDNRTSQTCVTWLLRELLRVNLSLSARKGFWQTFDSLVGDTFNALISEKVTQVIKAPNEYGFIESEVFEHFIKQQVKEIHPLTLPEEIRWFLAGALQPLICRSAVEYENQVLFEICCNDFGQPYIEHLLIKNDDVYDFINKLSEDLLK